MKISLTIRRNQIMVIQEALIQVMVQLMYGQLEARVS